MSTNILQTFSEKDIEFAEQIAKLSLSKEKEIEISNQISKSKSVGFDVNSDQDQKLESKDNGKVHTLSKSISNQENPTISQRHRRNREGTMRIKQIARIAQDISRLMQILEKKSKIKSSSAFITPIELEKKEKHWQDFCHVTRRTLYSLKREVNVLSVKISGPLAKLPSDLLRSLASSTRSCSQLLKGLSNFESYISVGEKGNLLLREILLIAQQLLFIITIGGGTTPLHKYPVPRLKQDVHSSFECTEDTLTRSVDVMSSDLDNSRIAALLKPSAVRKKLSTLAHTFKEKERKAKHSYSKYISPLRQESTNSKDSERDWYPMIEDLEDGRKIEFVNDNLSPKLRKRLPMQGKGKYLYSKDFHTMKSEVNSYSDQNETKLHTNASSYGVSEEMADAVFERILPYIAGSDKELYDHSNGKIENSNLEIYVYLEAQKKLIELQERFEKLERVTGEQKDLLSSINAILYEESSKSSNDVLNIDVAVQKANVCLEKCNKYSFPYHDSSAKVVLDNLLLSSSLDQKNGNLGQNSNIPSMEDDIKALKLEFWKNFNDKIQTNGVSHVQKNTLPSHITNGLHIETPVNIESDKAGKVGQDFYIDKANTGKGTENIKISTDSFAEQIKLGNSIEAALKQNGGSAEGTSIYSPVFEVSDKASSNLSNLEKMQNLGYSDGSSNSISKESSKSKDKHISEDGILENSKVLEVYEKCSEDLENEPLYSDKKLKEKLSYSKVESKENLSKDDELKNFKHELMENSEYTEISDECTEDSDGTSQRSSKPSETQDSENNDEGDF